MKQTQSLQEVLSRIGDACYRQRHLKKLKITTVSIDIGISHAVISRIENGRYASLSIALLNKLCDYYKIPLSSVFSFTVDDYGHTIEQIQTEISSLKEDYKQLLVIRKIT